MLKLIIKVIIKLLLTKFCIHFVWNCFLQLVHLYPGVRKVSNFSLQKAHASSLEILGIFRKLCPDMVMMLMSPYLKSLDFIAGLVSNSKKESANYYYYIFVSVGVWIHISNI